MAAANFSDVPLAPVDASLLSCWEEKVKQGVDCSLFLKHSKGKVSTILKCSQVVLKSPEARNSSSPPSSTPTLHAEEKKKKKKRKRNKGGKKKKLDSMLAFHQRLVDEKGLPPSRLMLEHAALAEPLSPNIGTEFQCDQCDFRSSSKRGLSVHNGHAHKESQKPETLRDLEHDQSLNLSSASSNREEISSSFNADGEEPDVEEIERIRSVLETTNQCYFCNYKAPVPWVHPSKGDNLSGRDIWDHVWAKHPSETDWFA